jgi:hypothetical protein
MSQNDDQNRKRQDEGFEDPNTEQSTRESRSDRSADVDQQDANRGASRRTEESDLEDIDEMDEDRDDDTRSSGPNRRNSIS